MLQIKYKLNQSGQVSEQELITNEDFVLIKFGGKVLLFNKLLNCIYMVNPSFKTLSKVSMGDQESKINKIKELFGKIIYEPVSTTGELYGHQIRKFDLHNISKSTQLSGYLTLISIPEIMDTALYEYFKLDEKNQPFVLPKDKYEITANLFVKFITPVGEQNQTIDLESIDTVESDKDFNEICRYPVMN